MALNNREKAISIHDPRLAAADTLSEAAHYLRMPEGTLRSWVYGRLYPASGDTKRSLPLIQLDDRTADISPSSI
ncbi:MAG TPA: hypothetical protein VGG97_07485 [Bryobacteraceae bacterium]